MEVRHNILTHMSSTHDAAALVARLNQIAQTSITAAIDEALRHQVWTPGTPWHQEEALLWCADRAAAIGEYQLAGLAAYQAQHLHLAAQGQRHQWGLPDLPGLDVASKQFNLVRYTALRSKNVLLRRPSVADRDFLLELFNDEGFTQLYSRPAGRNVEGRVYALIKDDRLCPTPRTPWAWMVCDTQGVAQGIVELSGLNPFQRSVDLALGVRNRRVGSAAAEAFLMGLFIAFHHLNLEQVTFHVYADNQNARELIAHLGMSLDYALDGLVFDTPSNRYVALARYSILRKEAVSWPPFRRVVRRYFPATEPDLLWPHAESLAAAIVHEGASWNVFPPRSFPVVPEPAKPEPQRQTEPEVEPYPTCLEGRRVTLKAALDEPGRLADWMKTKGFVSLFPHHLGLDADANDIAAQLGNGRGMTMLWSVEDKAHGQLIGFVGVEHLNRHPALFAIAGFDKQASPRAALESVRLLREKVLNLFPSARLYFKIPRDALVVEHLGKRTCIQQRGIQRHVRRSTDNEDRIDLLVFEWLGCCPAA